MKGLKKVALASAIAAVSAGAQAELKALDDATMGELTGQRGITIDVETKWEIGEFVYRDAGALVIEGIRMGSSNSDNAGSAFLDNFRMTIDVAGSGAADPDTGLPDNLLTYGFSEVIGLAKVYVANGNGAEFTSVATGTDTTRQDQAGTDLLIDTERTYGDGDLVIHFGFTDPWEKSAQGSFIGYAASGLLGSDNYANAENIATRAVDFRLEVDALGLASSDYVIGSQVSTFTDAADQIDGGATQTTTLISNLSIQGYLGPADLHIENDGNDVGNEAGDAGVKMALGIPSDCVKYCTSTNSGNADSKIVWGSFVNVTDLDIDINIAGVTLENIKIHNNRGDLSSLDGTSSFGFAHSIRTIYRVTDDILSLPLLSVTGDAYTDGLALNTQFKGDIDIPVIRFGDDPRSIGELYLTDVTSTTNWRISAH